MDRLQRSAVNMASGLLAWAAPVAVTFAATPMLVRRLGQEAYGLQNLAGVVVGYFGMMDLGLDLPVTKFLAEHLGRRDLDAAGRLLRTTLTLFLVVGAAGMAAIAASSGWLVAHVFDVPAALRDDARAVFLWSAPSFFAYALMSWGRAAANGAQRYDLGNGIWSAMTLASAAAGVAVVLGGGGVVAFVIARLACTALAAIAFAVALARLLPSVRLAPGFDREVGRAVRPYAFSGFGLRASGFMTVGLDRTMIGAWLGVAAVTAYAVPWMLLACAGQFVNSLIHFTFPMASELAAPERRDDLRRLTLRATGFVAVAATAIYVPLIALGDRFLALWLHGALDEDSARVLRLIALAGYLQTLAVTIANNIAVGTGALRAFTAYAVARGALIAVGLAVLLRPYGIVGAGYAMLLPIPLDVWFWHRIAVRRTGASARAVLAASYARPALLALALGLACWWCRRWAGTWPGLVAVCAATGAAHVAAAFAIGAFGATERAAAAFLLSALRRRRAGGEP